MHLPLIRNGRVALKGSGVRPDRLRSDATPFALLTSCQHVVMLCLGFFFHKLVVSKRWPQTIVRKLGTATGELRLARKEQPVTIGWKCLSMSPY